MDSNSTFPIRLAVCLVACSLIALQLTAMAGDSSPAGKTQETVLHSFGGPDGAGDLFGVIADKAGNLYGTTVFGGLGGGTVFQLTPGNSGYTETVLYSFSGGADGAKPFGALVRDKTGAFYGFAFAGGLNGGNCIAGCGTVYKLTLGKAGYSETTLYEFGGGADGGEPLGTPVRDKNGNIFGVTALGGAGGWGQVFELIPSGDHYTKSTIYSFPGGTGGYQPQAGIIGDRQGSIYGTTYYGGNPSACSGAGCGIVFKLTPSPSGYQESILYAFSGRDGAQPYAALTLNHKTGAVYGTTEYGGDNDLGTVFALVPTESGYSESVLHSFTGTPDGFVPHSQLLFAPNHALYGTAALGGHGCNGIGCGTVFQVRPSHPADSFKIVFRFRDPLNGADPESSALIMDSSGALYGTTRSGGTKTGCYDGGPGGALGCGVVFKLVP